MTAQIVYWADDELEDKNKIIESLKVTFSDFEDKALDVVTEHDIKRLRELEKEKNTKISSLLHTGEYPSTFKFKDIELLYDIPRNKILQYIDTLDEYDVRLAREERERKEEMAKNKEEFREIYWNKIYNNKTSLIQKSLELDTEMTVKLFKSGFYYKSKGKLIGEFKIDNIAIESEYVELSDNQNYCIRINNDSFSMSVEESWVSLIDDNLEYRFPINREFHEELDYLTYLYSKINSGDNY